MVFADFEIVGRLGQGGMGVVYEARDRALGRRVALKLLKGGSEADPEAAARFEREARAASKLSHPGIVAVHRAGVHEGQAYIAMDFVEGETLEARVRRVVFREAAALELARDLAHALAHAHDRGVAHRDLKPANILIDVEGRPRITDFGLAKDLESDARLTRSGAILGTLHYLSPEQARGGSHEVDGRADIYALGVILYELATGQRPYEGETQMEILRKIVAGEPVPPRRLRPQLSRAYQTVCLTAMSCEPGDRYPRAQDLVADLERCRRGEPVLARSPLGWLRLRRALHRRRWVLRAACVAALLAAGGAAAWQLEWGARALATRELVAAQAYRQQVEVRRRAAEEQRAAARAAEQDAANRATLEADEARRQAERERREQALALNRRAGDLALRGRRLDLVERAIALHTQAIEVDPRFSESFVLRGRACFRAGRLDEALADARSIMELDPLREEGPYLAALSLLRLAKGGLRGREPPEKEMEGRVADVLVQVEELERLRRGGARALTARAWLEAMTVGRLEEALGLLAEAQRIDPTLPEAYFLQAGLQSRYDLPIDHYRREEKQRFWALSFARFDLPAAQRAAEAFAEMEPFDRDGLLLRAHLRHMARDFDGARAYYDRLLELYPGDQVARLRRGHLNFQYGRHEECLADLGAVRDDVGESGLGLRGQALVGSLLVLQRYDLAGEEVERHLSRVGHRPRGVLLLVRALLAARLGDLEAARRAWRGALDVHTDLRGFFDVGGLLERLPPALRDVAAQGMHEIERVFEVDSARREAILQVETLRHTVPALRDAWRQMLERHQDLGSLESLVRVLEAALGGELAEAAARMDREVLEPGQVRLGDALLLMRYLASLARDDDLIVRDRLYRAEDFYRRAAARYRRNELREAWSDLLEARRRAADHVGVRLGQALVRATQGKDDLAVQHVFEAVLLGFQDLERLARDPLFRRVAVRPAFQRLADLLQEGF